MKQVLDTVVLVRGLIGPKGPQGELIFDRQLDFEWIISPDITDEYLDVLQRPALRRRFRAIAIRSVDEPIGHMANATIVEPEAVPSICRDPHDDMFLTAALAGDADYLVSEDLDLLSLGEYQGTVICDSQTMIDFLSAPRP